MSSLIARRYRCCWNLAVYFSLSSIPPVHAQGELNALGSLLLGQNNAEHGRDAGIITNQAVTVSGQDFYQFFSGAWREKDGSEQYSLAVRERPSARWGSEIWIEFRQRTVFRAFLPPARAAIKDLGIQAADIVFRGVMQTGSTALLKDFDIGADEI